MRIARKSALVVALVLAAPISASAHPGHEACRGGVPEAAEQGFLPPPGPGFGELVSQLATQGLVAATAESIHATFCTQR